VNRFDCCICDHCQGRLDRIERLLGQILRTLKQEEVQMSLLDDKIAALTAEVANETTVEESAVALLNGIPKMIADAVAAAQAAGATPAQLQSLTDLQTTLAANDTSLAAAVTANTPAAPAP
jgi:anti-sigma factor ChrR (cupin superfamily)